MSYIIGLVDDRPAPALYLAKNVPFPGGVGSLYIFDERQKDSLLQRFPGAELEPVERPPEGLLDYLAYVRPHSTAGIAQAVERWERGLGADPMEILDEFFTGGEN